MKTHTEWLKERDWMGSEYDTKERMGLLILEVQQDALSSTHLTREAHRVKLVHELLRGMSLLRKELEKQMIATATLDASLKGLTSAVDAAAAALAAGDSTTSTPDAVVAAYQAGVDAQTLKLASATPPPPAPAPTP